MFRSDGIYASTAPQVICRVWSGLGVYRFCLPQFVLRFASQILNKELDITGDNDVQQSASKFVKAMENWT